MKFLNYKFCLAELLLVTAALALLAALTLPAMAQSSPYNLAPQQPNFYRQDTNAFPMTLTNSGAATFTTNSLKLTVRQGTGVSLFATVVSTNSSSSGVVLGFDTSPDGTNATTTEPITWTLPSNFIGTNTYWTNIDRAYLNNVRTFQMTTSTNKAVGTGNTNTVVVTKFWYSYSGQ
jgi:hypothetical protein